MRAITKQLAPPELEAWLDGGEDWAPDYAALRGTRLPDRRRLYSVVLEALLAEQAYLCCYCQVQVTEVGGKASSIEHMQPQSVGGSSDVSYANMAASCQTPCRCNNARGDRALALLPHDPRCEAALRMEENGLLVPCPLEGLSQRDLEETLGILGLNRDTTLVEARELALRALLGEDAGLSLLTDEEAVVQLLASLQQPRPLGTADPRLGLPSFAGHLRRALEELSGRKSALSVP